MTTLKAPVTVTEPQPSTAELQQQIDELKQQLFDLTALNTPEATIGRAEIIKAAAGADGVVVFLYTARDGGPEVFAVSTMHISASLPVIDRGRRILINIAHNLAGSEAVPA